MERIAKVRRMQVSKAQQRAMMRRVARAKILIGRRYTDVAGQKWEVMGCNDLGTLYISKCRGDLVQKKQFVMPRGDLRHIEGER